MDEEKLLEDQITRQLQSLRVDGHLRNKILRDLKKLEQLLIEKLKAIDPEQTDRFKFVRLKKLISDVSESIDQFYIKTDKNLEKELTQLAVIEVAATSASVQNIDIILATTKLTRERIKAIYSEALIEGAPSSEWWSRQATTLKKGFEDNMRQGLLAGESVDQLTRRVRGTKALGYTDGLMEIARNNAQALVRSSVQAVANESRFRFFQTNDDVFKSYRHVSVLDSRTTIKCVVRDGKRWTTDLVPIGHDIPFQVPPIHWNCRSTIVAEVTELPKDAQRAAEGGPVKASTTFEQFLKKRGVAFQDEVLGKGKAELWRNGKITLSQLLDQRGNPLSLEQLKNTLGV